MVMVTLVVLLLVVMPGFLYLVGWAVNKYTGTKLDRSPVASLPAAPIATAKVEAHADGEFEMQP